LWDWDIELNLPKADVTTRTITADARTVDLVVVRPPGTTGALPAFLFFHWRRVGAR
jgi:hypothetical protein